MYTDEIFKVSRERVDKMINHIDHTLRNQADRLNRE